MTRPRLAPTLAAVGLAAGFGVLVVFAAFMPAAPDLPGLDAFPSAFIGDPLLLPIALALLVTGTQATPPAAGDRRFLVIGLLTGATGGILDQAMMLADRHPRLNWTIPTAHHFNAAGWWHASYLVTVSAVIVGVLSVFLHRIRSAAAHDPRSVTKLMSTPACALAISCLASYEVLVAADTPANLTSLPREVAVVVTAVGLPITVLALAIPRHLASLLFPALTSLVAAVAVLLLRSLHGPSGPTIAACLGSTAALAIIVVATSLARLSVTRQGLQWVLLSGACGWLLTCGVALALA